MRLQVNTCKANAANKLRVIPFRHFIKFVLALLSLYLIYVLFTDPDSITKFIIPFGNNGEPVVIKASSLSESRKKLYTEGWNVHIFNQYASDLIPVDRSLLDMRHPHCQQINYPRDLPQTSVVIVFCNQAWSVLVRCVHSLINRTPAHLLKEVILVDEASTFKELKKPLDDYMKSLDKVQIIRLPWDESFAWSRISGFNRSTAEVVTFLDSSVEVTEGWLEPLLQRIQADSSNIAVPVVDGINEDTFSYLPKNTFRANDLVEVGTFDWDLMTNTHPVKGYIGTKHADTDPVVSPVLTSSMFSISRLLFTSLGLYDPDMDTSRLGNLELSFKAGMCGGSVQVIPCSHVGRIVEKPPGELTIREKVNLESIALVWLDEFKDRFYKQYPGQFKLKRANTANMLQAKKKMVCTPFRDYLQTLPSFLLPRDWATPQVIRSKARDHCIGGEVGKNGSAVVVRCTSLQHNVFWRIDKQGKIYSQNTCFDYNPEKSQFVMLKPCYQWKTSQDWDYQLDSKIYHKQTDKCLEISQDFTTIIVSSCNSKSIRQEWFFGIRYSLYRLLS